jgi:hypothetical protein
LLRDRVLLLMAWSRMQAGKAHAVQRPVDGIEGDVELMLLAKDATDILAPQSADTILGGGAGLQPCPQLLDDVRRDLGQAPAAGLVADVLQTVVAVDVNPSLDESAGATGGLSDPDGLLAEQSQADDVEPIALLGAAFTPNQLGQAIQISAAAFTYLHACLRVDPGSSVPQVTGQRKPPDCAGCARESVGVGIRREEPHAARLGAVRPSHRRQAGGRGRRPWRGR